MTDIATLKIEVDSSQLDETVKKLDLIVQLLSEIKSHLNLFASDGMPECRTSQNK